MSDTEPCSNKQRKSHSPAWNYFKRLSPGLAKCDLCKKKLSYKTSITNLKRHLLLKHKVNLGYKTVKPFIKSDKEINVKKLINLVKQYPCLWDINCSFFTNSKKNIESWNAIASILCPEMDLVLAAAKLSERFCTLKENFFAEKLRLENGLKTQVSIYYNDLKFLDTSQECINISSASSLQEQSHMDVFEINEVNIKDEPFEESYTGELFHNTLEATHQGSSQVFHETAENNPICREEPLSKWTNGNKYIAVKAGMRKETNNTASRPKEEIKSVYTLQLNNANKDVLFLLSLNEEMKRVPNEMKTTFKGELMMTVSRLVRKYKRKGGNSYFAEGN